MVDNFGLYAIVSFAFMQLALIQLKYEKNKFFFVFNIVVAILLICASIFGFISSLGI